ncbi:GntR family transcriptional regulator [Kordiimonas marina]|uniref:GntR family transcriptional regulator n=1 Tax=Kordiimonas marina TaxID=2872312 RepID=UPI001FF5AB96|nr:GntR family transcriptional regulator [Kordiimonas marina]MCJ9429467.1 GntR family transcriptional regulator [Kordiimonas marina]
MQITIDIEAEEPLFAQLIAGIKAAIGAGSLKAGDALPSIRQLANDLDLNNKTVAKAYRLLERDHVIQTKGYRGTFVHPDAKAHVDFDLAAWLEAQLGEIIEACRARGATDSEIRIAFANIMQNK